MEQRVVDHLVAALWRAVERLAAVSGEESDVEVASALASLERLGDRCAALRRQVEGKGVGR